MAAGRAVARCAASWPSYSRNSGYKRPAQLLGFMVRASRSMDDNDRVYKQLGFFSLKRRIEDAVLHAEMLAPTALEVEEERRIKQEEIIRDCDLWDDPVKSNEILVQLADSAKAVNTLKDIKYKAEEAKLITQLAEMEAIDYSFFEQAYDASLDVTKFMHRYEMSKLLREPYDIEGACVVIKAGSGDANSVIWLRQLVSMYTKWAEKQGYEARVVDNRPSSEGGTHSATIEFEFEYAYGYLLGERGVHCMVRNSRNESTHDQGSSARVDVIPIFLRTAPDIQVNDEDLVITNPSLGDKQSPMEQIVRVQHIPTGITVESSGERNRFANKIKGLNRLKAKLLVVARERGSSNVNAIRKDDIYKSSQAETRRYISYPQKGVYDVKTGLQMPDLNSVLDGNIEPLIGAHINMRRPSHAI